jgi:simple sugar transport system ATP-binding protein
VGIPLAPDRPLTREPRLELRGIAKRFGPVQALRGADFTLRAGEVHALLGENGAGKTTLMHVAYGLVDPDGGSVTIDGRAVRIGSPREARRLGIGMVHQHFTSIPALTIAENVALETDWPVRPRELHDRVAALAVRLGMPLDPRARAESLSVATLQRLEIVKALATDARILLLDEPTAVLAPQEADELLAIVRRFAAAGGAAVLITHKLREALAAADRVTVLRDGAVALTGAADEQDADSLAAAMIGGPGNDRAGVGGAPRKAPVAATQGPPLVRALGLSIRDEGGAVAVHDAELRVRAGEIVGIAAVDGNGQRELLRALAGLAMPSGGTLEVAQPVAFIPEDRTHEGLIPALSLTENYVLGVLDRLPLASGLRIGWRAARRRTAALVTQADVRATGPAAAAATLSGGNQQKFIVARALEIAPRVIVAENPTRGLDLHATAAVHAQLEQAAADGAAVIVHSTDLDEVLALATRVVVVAAGRLRSVSVGADRDAVGRLMLGADA